MHKPWMRTLQVVSNCMFSNKLSWANNQLQIHTKGFSWQISIVLLYFSGQNVDWKYLSKKHLFPLRTLTSLYSTQINTKRQFSIVIVKYRSTHHQSYVTFFIHIIFLEYWQFVCQSSNFPRVIKQFLCNFSMSRD